MDWRCTPPEIPSVNRTISYLRDFGPGTTDTTDRYMMRWAADHLANLQSRAEHWQRVAANFGSPEAVKPVSQNNDGWCGEPCPTCNGSGEVDTVHSYASCGRCGGAGERYEGRLDKREAAE